MGIFPTHGPNTQKHILIGKNNFLRFGLCEMQGWRKTMEDATLTEIDFEPETSGFGIMDGHGGSTISSFVASNFLNLLLNMTSYQQGLYEQALIETFLKFDEGLRVNKINKLGKDNKNKSQNNGECCFFTPKDISSIYTSNINTSFEDISSTISSASKTSVHNGINGIQNDKIVNLVHNDKRINTVVKSTLVDKNSKEIKPPINITNKSNDLHINNKSLSCDNIHALNVDDLVAKTMGTTCNICGIKDNYIYCANVGDSLSVMYKNGRAISLNKEHKTTGQSEFERIISSGTEIINNRVEGKLNLTRAIGDLAFKNNQKLKFYQQAVIAYPEITKIPGTKGIEFIVMGCDGVWDCVDKQIFCDFLSAELKNKNKNKNIDNIISDAFDKTISKTNNSPIGTDNMSCIVIEFFHRQ